MLRWLGLMLCLTVSPAAAEEVVAGLSQNRVSITANFDGSEILIFGAIKREAPAPDDRGRLGVIITVAGPSEPIVVRRKDRRYGIWVNVEAVEVDAAPSFYAIATSDTFHHIISQTEDLRHQVSIPNAIRSVGAPRGVRNARNFSNALIRIRKDQGLYQLLDGEVDVTEDTLFRTSVALPANLTEGAYTTRFLITRDREVIDVHETIIEVQKVGLERLLYNLAHDQPFIYGVMSLAIAIGAGWGASAAFRLIRS